MSEYVRPVLPQQVFYDADGAVIDYGNRWQGMSPPDDTYSVVTNPERFAPLHAVAGALIEYLIRAFVADALENSSVVEDFIHPPDDIARAVRIVPSDPAAAPMTFAFTNHPGLGVHAGLLHDFWFPDCGCDACDESLESAAEELESTVIAVTEGGYTESVGGISPLSLLGLNVGYELDSSNGRRRSHRTRGDLLPQDRLMAAREQLRRLRDGWQPWPRPA